MIFFENRAVYEILWKDLLERGRPQMTLRRMRITCWLPKAAIAHTDSVILLVPLQKWLHERVSMLRNTYVASHVLLLVPSEVVQGIL